MPPPGILQGVGISVSALWGEIHCEEKVRRRQRKDQVWIALLLGIGRGILNSHGRQIEAPGEVTSPVLNRRTRGLWSARAMLAARIEG